MQLCSLTTLSFCLLVLLSDLGIGEVSGTHPPASSRLCFQVTKRRRTEEHRLDKQDYTRRYISFPYNWRRLWEVRQEQPLDQAFSPKKINGEQRRITSVRRRRTNSRRGCKARRPTRGHSHGEHGITQTKFQERCEGTKAE